MEKLDNWWYRISVKALIYNDKWEFLLCKEKSWVWDLPWWWLDHRENPINCLKRELHEEMWLVAINIEKNPSYFITSHKSTSKTRPWIANVCYKTEVENLDFTESDECVEIWFFDTEMAKGLDLLVNVEVLIKEMEWE